MVDGDELLLSVEGGIGWITLNRPSRLNALTPYMFRRMSAALRRWATDPDVRAVVARGAGGRAFCAGGDLRVLHHSTLEHAQDLWSEQFTLDLLISTLPKPYIALMDGIVMGSGLGLSAHGSHRIVSERTALAMPETRIGLVPDTGATLLFARAPGHLGEYMATTGATIGASDTLACGLADAVVPSAALAELTGRLRRGESVDRTIAAVAVAPDASPLEQLRSSIDDAFSRPTVASALSVLDEAGGAAVDAAAALRRVSPTAAEAAYTLVRMARRSEEDNGPSALARAMLRELSANSGLFPLHDRTEGIRAQVLDKDRAPRWHPTWDEGVMEDLIAAVLATDVPQERRARIE